MTTLFRTSSTQPSKLQQAIEKATDSSQSSEDWSLIMKICDFVGTHEESAKEALKIIRKRLHLYASQHAWRNIEFTLTLLEALTKNCGKMFHAQLAHKDFLKELKGVIGPKNNPPVPIQERVLSMIQNWALAFRNDPDLKTVEHFYQECKQHGLQFPTAEPENVIKNALTPTRSVDRPLQSSRSPSTQGYIGQNRLASDGMSHSVANNQTMSADQLAKLRSELDIVQANAQVFSEMLVTLQPAEENSQDFELLMELHNTCKQMQARVVNLLSQVTIDDITVDLLRYNDEFNNAFKTFDNYMQERNRRFSSPKPLAATNSTSRSSTNRTVEPFTLNGDDAPALIRFDDEPVASFQNMNIYPTPSSVVSRHPQQISAASATSRSTASHCDPESDVKEIEQWLKFQGDDPDNDESSNQEGGTSAAFDNFLQKRASTIPDEIASSQQTQFNKQDPQKQFQKTNTYF